MGQNSVGALHHKLMHGFYVNVPIVDSAKSSERTISKHKMHKQPAQDRRTQELHAGRKTG